MSRRKEVFLGKTDDIASRTSSKNAELLPIQKEINKIKYENRVNLAKIDNIKRSLSIKQVVLDERSKIIEKRKENIPQTYLFKKKQEQVRFNTAQSEFDRLTNENEKLKQELKSVYSEITNQIMPSSLFSNSDIAILQSSVDFYNEHVCIKRKRVLHLEEILSFVNFKQNSLTSNEKLFKESLVNLQQSIKSLNKRKVDAFSKKSQIIPCLAQIESIVFDIENDVAVLSKKYKSMQIEQSPRKAFLENLIDKNKERREILEYRRKLFEKDLKEYKSPQIQNKKKFQFSPRKSFNLESNFEEIKKEVHEKLLGIKNNTIKIEEETEALQNQFLEKRLEIEKEFQKKCEKIRELRSNIKGVNDIIMDISYYEEVVEEMKDNINKLQIYKRKLMKHVETPPVALISPRNNTKLGRIASKKRIIEQNEVKLKRLREVVQKLQKEVDQKEIELEESLNDSFSLPSIV